MTYPRAQPGQTLEQHQLEISRWMGVSVDAMNEAHDATHKAMCALLGIPSQSLRQAAGEDMTPRDYYLAGIEEEAALYLQRLLHLAGGKLP